MEDEEDRREETRGGGSVEESRGEKAVEGRGGSFFISFREHGGQRPLWRILLWRINVCTRVRIRRADMDARSRTIPIAPIRIVARGIRLDPCPNGYYIFIYMYIYMLGRVFQIWYIAFWKILEIFLLFNFDLLNLFLTPTVTIYIYLEFCKFSLDIRKNILNRMWKIFYYKFELDCSNMALVLAEFSKFRKDSPLFTHPT